MPVTTDDPFLVQSSPRRKNKFVPISGFPLSKVAAVEDEGKYRSFIENLPVLFNAVKPDPPFSPIYVSPAFTKFGYSLDQWLDDPNIWEKVIHPNDLDHVFTATSGSTSSGKDVEYEYRTVAADGSVIWVRDRGCLIHDEHGVVTHRQGVIADITETKKAEEDLRESESRYRNLFERASDIIYVHDLKGNYISMNQAAERVMGYERDGELSKNMLEILAPESLETVRTNMAAKVAGTLEQAAYELDCLTKDGRRITLEINRRPIYHDGLPVAIQGIARDITQRKRADLALEESEARFRELFENANDLIYTRDLDGYFTSLNRAGELITGYSREEAIGKHFSSIVAPEHHDYVEEMTKRKVDDNAPNSYEIEIMAKDGRRVALELSTRVIYTNGEPVAVQGIGRDITMRRQAEEILLKSARHDPLTGLPNRTDFMQHLQQVVKKAKGDPSHRFAVLFLDLDRFKVTNDSLGHVVGDQLLAGIAKRLKATVRPGDIVARLGGDEFTVLLNKVRSQAEAEMIGERIQKRLAQPFKFGAYEVFSSASIGIIVSDEFERTAEDFLRDADTAMYRAKDTGKARNEVFDSEMHNRNMNLIQIESDLRKAIDRKEFEIYYQPIVNLMDGSVAEFEALVRWNHPEKGLVAPNDFIPVAEETGLIIPMGRWILEQACLKLKEWQDGQPEGRQLIMSVNLSAKQLMHPGLLPQIAEIIRTTAVDPKCLSLEVTESTIIERKDIALPVLSKLRELGVSLSADDFGTGYSSLSYLHQFPFERIKIDRTFIEKMEGDSKTQAIVGSILVLGQNLKMEVVAEGIETRSQLDALRSLGCTLGQGFYFSRPVNAEAAEHLLASEFDVAAPSNEESSATRQSPGLQLPGSCPYRSHDAL
ncbi:MAG: EAL domain-containing protein [Acidobacteriota bacterium]